MSPKSLLRHPQARSPVRELAEGGFRKVIGDPAIEGDGDAERVRRLILCSGKVYYDLAGAEERAEASDIAIARVESLYPFPAGGIRDLHERYPNVETAIWTQEEPLNMGALTYILPRLRAVLPRDVRLLHVSRPERASPAEGNPRNHAIAQRDIVARALAARG